MTTDCRRALPWSSSTTPWGASGCGGTSRRGEALFEAWSGTWLSEDFRKWNIEAFLPRIVCPLMVLQGEKDEFGSGRQVEAMVGQVRGPSSQYMFPGLAHTPHKEAPEETLEVAAAFIRDLSN